MTNMHRLSHRHPARRRWPRLRGVAHRRLVRLDPRRRARDHRHRPDGRHRQDAPEGSGGLIRLAIDGPTAAEPGSAVPVRRLRRPLAAREALVEQRERLRVRRRHSRRWCIPDVSPAPRGAALPPGARRSGASPPRPAPRGRRTRAPPRSRPAPATRARPAPVPPPSGTRPPAPLRGPRRVRPSRHRRAHRSASTCPADRADTGTTSR